jgi:phage terminase small subunit
MKKQYEIFCNKFVETYNATQSALEAGYSKYNAKKQGYRLLQKTEIQKRIEELKNELNIDIEKYYNANKIIEKHIKIAHADLSDFAMWGVKNNRYSKGEIYLKPKVNSDNTDCEAVKRVKYSKKDGFEIELHDPDRSMTWLAKHFGKDREFEFKKSITEQKHELDKQRLKIDEKVADQERIVIVDDINNRRERNKDNESE